jgi:glyoxylase-like metal-dependent hydrolase (beta-lactamase superfamily II)
MTTIRRILAPNPGPFTLEGTNTWLVGEAPCLVIDPGPDSGEHVDRVVAEAGRISAILLTHRHSDHASAAARLAARSGAPVLAAAPGGGARPLAHGDVVEGGGGARLEVIATPGHTPDHLAFWSSDDGALFTGDAVLGRGTTVIDPPDGDLAAYLDSLRAMAALRPRVLHPGHGPTVTEAIQKLDEYLAHRAMREGQVMAGLASGSRSPEDLAAEIYLEYPAEVQGAAVRSVLAHLLKLEREGRVVRTGSGPDRYGLAG